ncbi:hypothetical protein ABFA07_002127 [Porites harrisoni]
MVDEKPASTRPFSVKIEINIHLQFSREKILVSLDKLLHTDNRALIPWQSSREMILVSLDKVLHRDNKSLIPLKGEQIDA